MVMHHDVPTQAMDSKPWAAEMVVGADQVAPLKKRTWFKLGTAAQKVGAVQLR